VTFDNSAVNAAAQLSLHLLDSEKLRQRGTSSTGARREQALLLPSGAAGRDAAFLDEQLALALPEPAAAG